MRNLSVIGLLGLLVGMLFPIATTAAEPDVIDDDLNSLIARYQSTFAQRRTVEPPAGTDSRRQAIDPTLRSGSMVLQDVLGTTSTDRGLTPTRLPMFLAMAETDESLTSAEKGVGADPLDQLDEKQKWSHTLLTYIWIVGISGDLTVGSRSVDVDIEFSDIVDKFSGGVSLIYEGHNDDWLVYFDGTALFLEDDPRLAGIELDVEASMAILEGGLGYRITSQPFPKAFVGFRYIGVDAEIDSPIGAAETDFDSIVDPIIGIYHKHQFTDQWGLRFLADIGGFGVGTDFSWGIGIGLTYQIKRNWNMEFGYRILDLDYDGDKLDFDGNFQGIYLGIGKRF